MAEFKDNLPIDGEVYILGDPRVHIYVGFEGPRPRRCAVRLPGDPNIAWFDRSVIRPVPQADDIEKEQKLLVAMGGTIAGPIVVLGMSDAAWDHCRDGKTHTLNLNKIGIRGQIILFGGRNHEQMKGWLADHARTVTSLTPERDLGIDLPTKQ